jgi:hypothetical protein
MTKRTKEKREFIRVPFAAQVEIQAQGLTIRSESSIDICMNGIRFMAEQTPVVPGAACGIKIFLSGAEPGLIIEARGTVVRSDAEGLAVTFAELDIEGYQYLRQIILNNADDAGRAEREIAAHWGIRKPLS